MSYVRASPRLPRLSRPLQDQLRALSPELTSLLDEYFRAVEREIEDHAHAINNLNDAQTTSQETAYGLSADFPINQTWTTIAWDLQDPNLTDDPQQQPYNPSNGILTIPEGVKELEINCGTLMLFDNSNTENNFGLRVRGAGVIHPATGGVTTKKGDFQALNISIPQFNVQEGDQFWTEAFIDGGGSNAGDIDSVDLSTGERFSYIYWRLVR